MFHAGLGLTEMGKKFILISKIISKSFMEKKLFYKQNGPNNKNGFLLKTILYFFPLGYLVVFITLYTIFLVFIAVISKLTLGAKGYNETQKRNI